MIRTAFLGAMTGGLQFWVGSCALGLLLGSVAVAAAPAEIPFKHIVVDDDGPTDMHSKAVGDLNGDGFPRSGGRRHSWDHRMVRISQMDQTCHFHGPRRLEL